MNPARLQEYNSWITNYIDQNFATVDNWGIPTPKVYFWTPEAKEIWFYFSA